MRFFNLLLTAGLFCGPVAHAQQTISGQPHDEGRAAKVSQVVMDMDKETEAGKKEQVYLNAIQAGVPIGPNAKNQLFFPRLSRAYAEENNKKQFEYWVGQSTVPGLKEGQIEIFVKHGEYNYVMTTLSRKVDSLRSLLNADGDKEQLMKAKGSYDGTVPPYAESALKLKKFTEAVRVLKPLYTIGKQTFQVSSLYLTYAEALAGVGEYQHGLKVLTDFYLMGEDRSAAMMTRIKAFSGKVKNGEAFFKRLCDSSQTVDRNVFAKLLKNKPSITGAKISADQLKGKYVLLDFWGSWCGPCRQSHPELIKTYEKFKDRGLDMIGIAVEGGDLEKAKASWKSAVQADGLPWLQILDNEAREDFGAAFAYKIYAYPTKILLEKDGTVIARYMGGSTAHEVALDQKLTELLADEESKRALQYKLKLNELKKKFSQATDLVEKEALLSNLMEPTDELDARVQQSVSELQAEMVLAFAKSKNINKSREWLKKIKDPNSKVRASVALAEALAAQKRNNEGLILIQPVMDQILDESLSGVISNEQLNGYANLAMVYVKLLPVTGNEAAFIKYLKPLYVSGGNFFFADTYLSDVNASRPLQDFLFYNYARALSKSAAPSVVAPVLASYLNGRATSSKREAELLADFTNLKNLKAELAKYKTAEPQLVNENLFRLLLKPDLNGKIWGKAGIKSKYLLLDFWGSWCIPCRQSHPHLKEIYQKYKDKGLEIVGVSSEGSNDMDRNYDNWKKAVHVDGLPWVQFLNDHNQVQFDAAKSFGVSVFPTKILIDQQGNILGTFTGGDAIDQKLAEIFK